MECEEIKETSIPNTFIEFWMKRISSPEFKILMCLAIDIYGPSKGVYDELFQLKGTKISILEIMEKTGLGERSVKKAINTISKREFVVIALGNSGTLWGPNPNEYYLNTYPFEK